MLTNNYYDYGGAVPSIANLITYIYIYRIYYIDICNFMYQQN